MPPIVRNNKAAGTVIQKATVTLRFKLLSEVGGGDFAQMTRFV
ncbi:MAG TPA: hypothetical protein VFE51_20950 [Verrucomicrobiae bacterium]|nr:hypothetical protein [Verrucomicrobiae bacterium]